MPTDPRAVTPRSGSQSSARRRCARGQFAHEFDLRQAEIVFHGRTVSQLVTQLAPTANARALELGRRRRAIGRPRVDEKIGPRISCGSFVSRQESNSYVNGNTSNPPVWQATAGPTARRPTPRFCFLFADSAFLMYGGLHINTHEDRSQSFRWALLVLLAVGATVSLSLPDSVAQDKAPTPVQIEFFEKSVRPMLGRALFRVPRLGQSTKAACGSIAGRTMMEGGDSGPAIVPGNVQGSLLVKAIHYGDTPKMPPKGKLSNAEIATLTEWIQQGAPWPEVAALVRPAEVGKGFAISAQDREFWSFKPLGPPSVPEVAYKAWPKNAIDHFILAGLEANGSAACRAGRQTDPHPPGHLRPDRPAADAGGDRRLPQGRLARRLRQGGRSAAGLAALRRALGAALARRGPLRRGPGPHLPGPQVPRGLPLPRLAHQGVQRRHALRPLRHWSRSPPTCSTGPTGWKTCPPWASSLCGPVYYGDPKKLDQYDDRIDTLTRGLLGLTVACARCHDHKFDPIPTKDYYSLAGVFASTDYVEIVAGPRQGRPTRCQPPPKKDPKDKKAAAQGAVHSCRQGRQAGDAASPHPRQPGHAGREVAPAVPGDPRRRRRQAVSPNGQRPAGTGPGHRQQGQPADGPRHRQSRLAAPFRQGPGAHAEQLRRPRRTADASGAARLPGQALHGLGLVDQGAAPRNRAVGRLPDEQPVRRPRRRRRSRQQAPLAHESPPPGSGSLARRHAGRRGHARPQARRPVARPECPRQPAADALRRGQPARTELAAAAVRFPRSEHHQRATHSHHRAAAAVVCAQQRIHGAKGQGPGVTVDEEDRPRRRRPHSRSVPAGVRPPGDRARVDTGPGVLELGRREKADRQP